MNYMPKKSVYEVKGDDETLDGKKKGFFGKTPNWLRNIACVFSGLTLGFVNVEPKVNFENKFANKFAEFFLKTIRTLLSITVAVLLFAVLPLAVPPLAPLAVIGLGVGTASVFLNGARAEKREKREGQLRPKNQITEKTPKKTEKQEKSSDTKIPKKEPASDNRSEKEISEKALDNRDLKKNPKHPESRLSTGATKPIPPHKNQTHTHNRK